MENLFKNQVEDAFLTYSLADNTPLGAHVHKTTAIPLL